MALPIGELAPFHFDANEAVLFGISLILRSSGLSIPQPIRKKRLRYAIGLLTAVSTIVRLEIALFLLPVVLSLVIQRRISFTSALFYGVISGLGSLGMSSSTPRQWLTPQRYLHQSIFISGYQRSLTLHSPSTPGNN
jgi:hypothetical protein